jgi:hypothetical protein
LLKPGRIVQEELETFEVDASPRTIEPTTAHEGTNAARFALMALLGPTPHDDPERQIAAVSAENLERFGLNPDLASRSLDDALGQREYREAEFLLANYPASREQLTELRYTAFARLNTEAQIDARLAFLAAGLGSSLERESATAASAVLTSITAQNEPPSTAGWRGWPYRFLDRRIDSFRFAGPLQDFTAPPDEDGEPVATIPWDGAAWQRYYSYWIREVLLEMDPDSLLAALRFLAQVRADVGRRSADPIVRELAFASHLNRPSNGASPHFEKPPTGQALRSDYVSTMVHGTWGWKGDWWYPNGDFHSFIGAGIRPGLYAEGQEFSWSGALSEKQRALGGDRFARWVDAAGGGVGLGTVFGHSYGGEIIARAVNAGSKIDEVVFLSAPVHAHHRQMLSAVRRVVDVRLNFDIVLTAARASQYLPPASNVIEYVVDQHFWSHGATHNPDLWAAEGIAAAVGL